ncbi:polysaccharide deacetylase family protein [uncultured Erythrobacter sp.]|uniref:polysaccharide deacetylase family protein n=1 Tax=uncultured Erythrobacter sp. TaxID=263913 RepID=UPI00345CF7D9
MAAAELQPEDTQARSASEVEVYPSSMTAVPHPRATAEFVSGFSQRVLLTIDTEEEFDWEGPFTRDKHGLSHVAAIPRFQAFCEKLGAHPIYLVDWPIANNPFAVEVLGDAVQRGTADVGVQLHPWVNPPFEETLSPSNSFAGNLPPELERVKFMLLRDQIEAAFGEAPLIYRAGRYGLGSNTAEILKEGGIKVDTSVRPLFDYSAQNGPDYSNHPMVPYWVDHERTLLEAPMTVVHRGAMRPLGLHLQKRGAQIPPLLGALARLGLLERITLTPEGVTAKEALRGLELTLEAGLPLTVLSFHSPSLMPGLSPYTSSESEVDELYDWFAQIYDRLAKAGVRSASVDDVIAAVRR